MFLIIVAAIILTAVIFHYTVSTNIKITDVEIKSEKLPESFDGYKIALISDLHDRKFGDRNKQVKDKLKSLSPDIIIFGGDMHEYDGDDKQYFDFAEDILSIAPVYAAEGNHDPFKDTREDYSRYLEKLDSLGIRTLNGSVFLDNGNKKENIVLSGIGYYLFDPAIRFDNDYFNIFILHNPLKYDMLEQKPDLTLSGHVHGGCIRLPIIGALLSPGDGAKIYERIGKKFFFPKYSEGVYNAGSAKLAVSVGLGGVRHIPVRLLRPEIMNITLKCK